MGILRATAVLLLGLLLALGPGCAQRFKLSDTDLKEAKDMRDLGALRVYASHRIISVYDEPARRALIVEREIKQSSRRERRKRILRRGTAGAIVGNDRLNGQRLLWVTFDRQCATPECAYGFVHAQDQRYLLVHVPEREGYLPPRIHRSLVLKRHRLEIGFLRSLTTPNQVYRLERKRRIPVVFLELKRSNRDRVEERAERESGV